MTNTLSRDDVKVLNQVCTYMSNATGASCGAKTTDIIHGLLGLFSFSLFFLFFRGRGSLVVFFLCNMEFYLSFGRFCFCNGTVRFRLMKPTIHLASFVCLLPKIFSLIH